MIRRLWLPALLLVVGTLGTTLVMAQESSQRRQRSTSNLQPKLSERLGQLGRRMMGSADEGSEPPASERSLSRTQSANSSQRRPASAEHTPWSSRKASQPSPAAEMPRAERKTTTPTETTTAARPKSESPRAVKKEDSYTQGDDDLPAQSRAKAEPPRGKSSRRTAQHAETSSEKTTQDEASNSESPAAESADDVPPPPAIPADEGDEVVVDEPAVATHRAPSDSEEPSTQIMPEETETVTTGLADRLNAAKHAHEDGPSADSSVAEQETDTMIEEPAANRRPMRARVAERIARSKTESSPATTDSASDPNPSEAVSVAARPTPTRVASAPTLATPLTSNTPIPAAGVVSMRESPQLHVETIGPKQIRVGAPATYKVVVYNGGKAAARQVVVSVALPEWAEINDTQETQGTTRGPQSGDGIEWLIDELGPSGRETLDLRITPRKPNPLDLAVTWSHAPVAVQTVVEVQEPKLELVLSGPEEVQFGERQTYRLTVSNPGNGDAEKIVVRLLPTDPSDHEIASHDLGTLKAGQNVVLDLELTARRAGSMMIDAEANADGGLHARAKQEVLVRRAALAATMEGPKFLYAGTVATYHVKVQNTGTATAGSVAIRAELPPGAKCLSASHSGQTEGHSGQVTWNLGRLDAGADTTCQMRVKFEAAGAVQPQVHCSADGGLTALTSMLTEVEAVADLVLAVNDPQGPVPIEEEVQYEVRIRNRGSKASDPVDVAVYFSEGIDPTKAEGGRHEIGEGQVTFATLPTVEPGKEVVLKIKARATCGGNHVFRAEARTGSTQTVLAAEETTHFYDTGSRDTAEPVADPAYENADSSGN
jgi:uncharacterized repeat protein (TIGR01451 family)